MAEIKSALELALEKAEQFGRASKEDLLLEKHRDAARQVAVRYLKEEVVDLKEALAAVPPEAQTEARQAMKEVFLRNITLPREEKVDPRQERALEGLLAVASNPKAMARLKGEVEQLWQQFLLARNTAYQQLKNSFRQTLGNYTRALEAQLGAKVRLEADQLPEFQQEWRKFEGSLTNQFEPILTDRKEKMRHL